MTPDNERTPDAGGDDHVAAEYVLGVLPADERRALTRRIETDAGFARLVEAWEERLSPLNAGYDNAAPPASVKQALDARLFGRAPAAAPRPGLLQSLAFWRGLAVAGLAAFVIAVAIPLLRPATVPPDSRLIASLAADKSDVRYLAAYDARASEIGLSHLAGDRTAGHDFELWIIKGNAPPVSLGVIPAGSHVHLVVAPGHRSLIDPGAQFAITLEPRGGAPEGKPTGPVVASGDLRTL